MFTLRSALALALFVVACKGQSSSNNPDNRPPQPSALGSRTDVPNVRWIKGEDLGRLARAYGNSGTLFNIWATWCGSCQGEMPKLRAMANAYAARGIHVVLISVDEPEQFDNLEKWLASRGFKSPAWVAQRPLGRFKSALASNWLGNIPVSLLYDSRGKRRYFWNGPVETSEVEPILNGFLDGKTIDGEKHYSLSEGIVGSAVEPVPPQN